MSTRFDPYENFKFRVTWDGRHIPGVSRVSALTRTTELVEHREGGDPSSTHKFPGRTAYAPITLERGLTDDQAFETWANQVWQLGSVPESSLNFRKDVTVELMDEAGRVVRRYLVHRCWPSEYQALPALDANGQAAVAIEGLTLENEGWERDTSVAAPAEPA